MIAWCNSNQGFIMALLTIVYVATTFFIWLSKKKTNKIAMKQLDEMRTERISREQPIVILSEPRITVAKPSLFYSPPDDDYSFLSKYYFLSEVNTISKHPALFVDVLCRLVINTDDGELFIKSAARRINILDLNKENISCMLTGDSQALIFEALRSDSTEKLPKIEVILYYKSTSGGFYRAIHQYYVLPDDNDGEIIRNWHGMIIQAPAKFHESINYMIRNKNDEQKSGVRFDSTKEEFKSELLVRTK